MNISVYSISTFFILIATFALFALLVPKRKNKQVRAFLLLLHVFVIWQVIELIFRLFSLGDSFIILWRIVISAAVFYGPLLYRFSSAIIEEEMNKKTWISLNIIAVVISVLSLTTDLFASKLSEPESWGRNPMNGPLYFIFAIFLIATFVLIFFKFYQAYRQKKEQRKIIYSIALGLFLIIMAVVLTNFIPVLFAFNIPSLGGVFVLFLFLIMIRTMYIHQLFEINIKQIGLGKKLLLAFLFVSISSSFIFGFSAYFREKKNIEQSIYSEIEILVNEKGKWLEHYLEERKTDMRILGKNVVIRNMFNKKIKDDINYAKLEIKNKALEVSGQIELFLKEHSDMSVADLQEDPEFQKIAVQSVGTTGYTALTNYNSLVCRFHKNPDIVDMNLENLAEKLPDFWQIMKASQNGKVASGFYDWREQDGSIKQKYMYIAPLKISTSDGVYFSVAATTYLDDFDSSFQLMGEAESFLEEYRKAYGFENLFLIGADDRVWWEAEKVFGIGTNISNLGFDRKKFAINYEKSKSSQDVVIFNCACRSDEKLKIFAAIPIYNRFTGEFIGVIIEQFAYEQFSELMNTGKDTNKKEVVYLVDDGGDIMNNFDSGRTFFYSNVKELSNFKNCFKYRDLKGYGSLEHYVETQYYYGILGEEVLGTHFYIKELNWCLLLETSLKEARAPLAYLRIFFIGIGILITLLAILLSYLFSRSLISPILKLTKGAKELARKNFKYKININTRDELELLGKTINQAGEDLEKAEKDQKKYQSNLEGEIEAKTNQLKIILNNIQKDKDNLENQQKAMLNILEDASMSQVDLSNSKNTLEKKQKELEFIVSLSRDLSRANDFEQIADILYKHLNNIFDFKSTAFFVFSQAEKKVNIFRIYCNEKMENEIIFETKNRIKKFLLEEFKIRKKEVDSLISLDPRIFGKKPGILKINKKYKKRCFVLRHGSENLGIICFRTKDKISSENIDLLNASMLTVGVFVSGIMSSLKSQHSKTKSLVNSTSNGIIMFDEKGEINLINPAALNLAQSDDKNNDLSKIFEAVKETGENLEDKLNLCIKKGEVINLKEIKIGDKFVEILINPVKDDTGKIMGSAMVMHDITQIKQIDNMKTEFVSVASHQLRTPLTAIKLFTEMLMNEQVGKLKKDQKNYLDNIYQSTDRMVRLVNDLLNVSRIESGRLSIVPEPVFMENFISTIMSEAQPLAQAKKCKIEFLKPKKKLAEISIDKNLVRQVVHNLITNAIKYSREKGGFVKVELSEYNKSDILIKVSDNGIGIPRKLQDRMFQKFFRADNAVKTETEGTGLGLYVAKMIVETSGGKIWFESQENKGTTFYVTLPKKGMKEKKGEKGLSLS